MDGVTFLQTVRADDRWKEPPLVVLTAAGEGPLVQRAEALGVNFVFRKAEFRLAKLLYCLDRLAPPPAGPPSN